MLALWQRRWHSTQSAALEIEDTLKVAALIHSFRNDGHLAAALDPLQRVRQGPWLTESRQATTWYAALCRSDADYPRLRLGDMATKL